jgi:hypothetical protein
MAQVERGEVSLGLVGRKTDNPHLEFRYLASDRMMNEIPDESAGSRRLDPPDTLLDPQPAG